MIVLERQVMTMHSSLRANDCFPKAALEATPAALGTPASGLQMLSHLLNRANKPAATSLPASDFICKVTDVPTHKHAIKTAPQNIKPLYTF